MDVGGVGNEGHVGVCVGCVQAAQGSLRQRALNKDDGLVWGSGNAGRCGGLAAVLPGTSAAATAVCVWHKRVAYACQESFPLGILHGRPRSSGVLAWRPPFCPAGKLDQAQELAGHLAAAYPSNPSVNMLQAVLLAKSGKVRQG